MEIINKDNQIIPTKIELKITPSVFRSRRDELIDSFVNEINIRRANTKFKFITHREVAIRISKNPFFKGRDGEIELLLKTCIEKNSFSKFFFICPLK